MNQRANDLLWGNELQPCLKMDRLDNIIIQKKRVDGQTETCLDTAEWERTYESYEGQDG